MPNLFDILKREMALRNYSSKTFEAYFSVIRDFYYFDSKPLQDRSQDNIKDFLLAKQKKNLSSQTVALAVNALNFLYTQIYKRKNF